jgi:cell division protease FtsH
MFEIVEFLKTPLKFIKKGARIPRGVLLFGEPGTGKTLLAKAVAGESGATFFSIAGSEFVEMFVGVGAARVRDTFDKAKKEKKAIVFVDEIDAIGRSRAGSEGPGNEERGQALNQMLVEMDGMDTAAHVIVIAATNRPDVLDKALLRPGRFDRLVGLDKPNRVGRLAILTVHAKDKPLDVDVKLETIAGATAGLSGADLANLLNEAAILSARYDHEYITLQDIDDATMRVVAGPEKKSRIISDHERDIIAYHETGHALVMHTLPGNDPVTKVSITSRGMALGITVSSPIEDRYLVAKSEIEARLAGIMGGRAAEFLIFGDITSGASNDLQKATEWAQRMVTEWGMSEKLGQLAWPHASVFSTQRGVSNAIAEEIDNEVRAIVHAAFEKALEILTTHRAALDRIATQLIAVENIDGVELQTLFLNA